MELYELRQAARSLPQDEMNLAGAEVIARYGALFDPSNLQTLTSEDFLSFLRYKNNKHWTGINRQGGMLTQDMDRLRGTLQILLDETRPIEARLDELFPAAGDNYLKGLGRAVATPILMMVYPDRYGVFNSISEQGLKNAGLFPALPRGSSFAKTYVAVNDVLLQLTNELGVSLWGLDTLWWRVPSGTEEVQSAEGEIEVEEPGGTSFTLERYLADYLYENWDNTIFGLDHELYEESGDPAQEYPTSIGRIDLLARRKDKKGWLVVELKRDRSSDAVIGQVMRYIGWVYANLASSGETVHGCIVLHTMDEKLRYALSAASSAIDIYTYTVQVDFRQQQVTRH